MRHARWTWLWLGLVCLAGCASPPANGTKAEKGLIEPAAARQLGYYTLWAGDQRVPARRGLDVYLLDDVLLTVERHTNVVAALAVRDGRTLWTHVVGSATEPLLGAARVGDRILVNSNTRIYQLELASGQSTDNPLAVPVSTGPAIVEDLAIFGGTNSQVFAHSLVAGRSRWVYQMNGEVGVRPVLVPGTRTVFVADKTGAYALLGANDGELAWKGRTFARNTAQPVAGNLGIFLASEDQSVYAINRSTGRDRWRYRSTEPLRRDLMLAGTALLVPLSRKLVALDAASEQGAELWQAATPGTPVGLIDRGLLINEGNRLLVLDPQTGKSIGQYTFTQPVQDVLLLPNKSLLLVTAAGRVQRLDALR